MIIIAGTIDLDPNRLEDALSSAHHLIAGARTEDGCLDYTWAPDPLTPGRIYVYERWQDSDSLAGHFASHWYTDMRDHMGQFSITGVDVNKYKGDVCEPVYDDNGVPQARFAADR